MRVFADIETTVQDMLAPLVGGLEHVGSETPANLQDVLPFIRVTRYGGADDGQTDIADIDVDCYGDRRTATWQLAEVVRLTLTASSHLVLSEGRSVVIDAITTTVGPFQPPREDEKVRRYSASYTVRSRRTPMN